MKEEKNVLYGPEPSYNWEKSTAGKQLYDALLKHSHLPEAMVRFFTNFVQIDKSERTGNSTTLSHLNNLLLTIYSWIFLLVLIYLCTFKCYKFTN